MSDTTDQQITIDDLNYFWTHSGVPCFMADRENIEDIIESLGFNIYYLICNIAEDKKAENKVWTNGKYETTTHYTTELSTGIVKVVKNFVGRAVCAVTDEDIYDFQPVRESAFYNLPAIPKVIVDKLDEFFRMVHAQHGTESIVILTFDPTKDDSSGWGVLVPEQTNTSVHCKYEADSIVEQKPDHVLIVGSVHSHPEMAAYASGTDHADQADFDGIHITYGWQKSVNGGATQYHIELQMAGNHWTLKPEDVFEDHIFQKDPDPEVLEWTKNVKKVQPPQGGSAFQAQASSPVRSLGSSQPQTHPLPQVYTPRGTIKGDPQLQTFPDPKDSNPYLVIAEIDYASQAPIECPSCGHALTFAEMSEDVCPTCDIILCDTSYSFTQIVSSAVRYLHSRGLTTNRNYYVWVKETNGSDSLMKISDYEPDDETTLTESSHSLLLTDDSPNKIKVEEIDEYYYEGFSKDRTICCDISMSEIHKCTCYATVFYDDIIDFDYHHPYDVYSKNGDCINCEFYYSRSCTPYFTAIMNFAQHKLSLTQPIEQCKSFMPYSSYKTDDMLEYHYY